MEAINRNFNQTSDKLPTDMENMSLSNKDYSALSSNTGSKMDTRTAASSNNVSSAAAVGGATGIDAARSKQAAGDVEQPSTTGMSKWFGYKQRDQYKPHPTLKMQAGQWHGTKSMSVATVPRPALSASTDAIVNITSTTVCGSDLHYYNNSVSGTPCQDGDIIGHEAVGIVSEVGSDVKNVKVGDRVVISGLIACGSCEFCKKKQFSLCDNTNPSVEMEQMYGHRLVGVFGYSTLLGSYGGLQAEAARIPFADNNLLVIKKESPLTDSQLILLSDILCTAWHANQLGEVSKDDVVCIWGCGPVGLLAGYLAKHVIGATRVISIDSEPYRLDMAQRNGCEVINWQTCDVVKRVQEMVPGGPDVCIDCVGFRFPKSTTQKLMFKAGLQTDAIDTIKEIVHLCKKGGRVSLIGDYFGLCNGFPIGAMMEKSLTVRGGQVFVLKYWKELLAKLESGEIKTDWLISHRMPLSELSKAYTIFNEHQDNCTKVLVYTPLGEQMGVHTGGRSNYASGSSCTLCNQSNACNCSTTNSKLNTINNCGICNQSTCNCNNNSSNSKLSGINSCGICNNQTTCNCNNKSSNSSSSSSGSNNSSCNCCNNCNQTSCCSRHTAKQSISSSSMPTSSSTSSSSL